MLALGPPGRKPCAAPADDPVTRLLTVVEPVHPFLAHLAALVAQLRPARTSTCAGLAPAVTREMLVRLDVMRERLRREVAQ